jgi:nicotinate-nucleotide pyrophosphorylase (carboxylating)
VRAIVELKVGMTPIAMTAAERAELDRVVEAALAEDIGAGDITTAAVVPADVQARGRVVARQAGCAAGTACVETVYRLLSPDVRTKIVTGDGRAFEAGAVLADVQGPANALLTGERVALNLLARLCGIATLSAKFVAEAVGTRAKIMDTRKTTPLLRILEKYAVRAGGATNHREGLYDQVLIKDNHLAALRQSGVAAKECIEEAIRRARSECAGPIEIEVDHPDDAMRAADTGADIILFDNFSVETMARAVKRIRDRCAGGGPALEASGNMSLKTVASYAATGVDRISVGALTHAAVSLDLGLDFEIEQSG